MFFYSADEQTKKKKINERGTVTNDALIEVGKPLYLVVKLLLSNQMNGETNFKFIENTHDNYHGWNLIVDYNNHNARTNRTLLKNSKQLR